MLLKIISTTDRKFIGRTIDVSQRRVVLCNGFSVTFDSVNEISPGTYRLASPNYIIDAKELNNG